MSLTQAIESVIENYVEKISEKFGLDKSELMAIWNSNETKTPRAAPRAVPKQSLESIDMTDLSIERLTKASKAELTALCKARSCKCTGTKDVLINRLLGKEEDAPVQKSKKEKSEPKAKAKTAKTERGAAATDVVKKLTADIPVIPVRRNNFGNFVHPESGIVFDRATYTAIGKQEDDGKVSDLTDEDIETCKRYKFKYNIPSNLDKNSLENVKIEGIDDDSDVEAVEEDIEEEEIEEDDEEEDEIIEDDD